MQAEIRAEERELPQEEIDRNSYRHPEHRLRCPT